MKPNYNELTNKLIENSSDTQNYSFEDVERIIGTSIPPVYIEYRTFKQSSSKFQQYAKMAGYLLTEVDYDNHTLTFQKDDGTLTPIVRRPAYNRHIYGIKASISLNALDPNDLGKNLDEAVRHFKSNWSSTGGDYVPFCNKYNNLQDVYYHAGLEAYRAAMKRAITYGGGLTTRQINDLKEESCRYLQSRFAVLFAIKNINQTLFNEWIYETATEIRRIYRDNDVSDYTYGNAQKIINVAIKFVLSSNLVDYHNEVFKVCHFPVDGRIQATIKSQLGVHLLHQNGRPVYGYSSWSKNDNWSDFIDYQARVRQATEQFGYYSPLIWEATHWN